MDDETRQVLTRITAIVMRVQRSRALSTAELARRSTVDPAELESILRGEVDLRLHTLYLLAGALGVRPTQLLQGIEWVPDGSGGGRFRVEDPEGG